MGANTWKHVPSLDKMESSKLRLYLGNAPDGQNYKLLTKKLPKEQFLSQTVNLADRTVTNNDYYPDPIIKTEIDRTNGLFFISEPFDGLLQSVVHWKGR
jgi:hypothetical protein